MRKSELVHLHGLFAELTRHLEENHGVNLDLEDYHSMKVRPTSIHVSKTDHKRAILTLSNELRDELDAAVSFSIESIIEGRLQPRTDDESILLEIFLNLCTDSPETVADHIPILLSFIRNGNATAQRLSVEALTEMYGHSPQQIQILADRLEDLTGHVNEWNTQKQLEKLSESAKQARLQGREQRPGE